MRFDRIKHKEGISYIIALNLIYHQEIAMIKCHLSTIMGERRLKIADVARDTNINRGTITRMYHEEANRVDLDIIEQLCLYFRINVGDLYEVIDDSKTED